MGCCHLPGVPAGGMGKSTHTLLLLIAQNDRGAATFENGKGYAIFANGSYYHGELKGGKRHGRGLCVSGCLHHLQKCMYRTATMSPLYVAPLAQVQVYVPRPCF